MLRFFKRLAEGQYDVEGLHARGLKLMQFLTKLAKQEDVDLSEMILVGFSNGANMAVNLLLQDQSPFQKAMLFSPMYPVDVTHLQEGKQHTKVFLSLGEVDPIVPLSESKRVVEIFEERHAEVDIFWGRSHEVSLQALEVAKDWLKHLK